MTEVGARGTSLMNERPFVMRRKTCVARANVFKSDRFKVLVDGREPSVELAYLMARHLPIASTIKARINVYLKGGGFSSRWFAALKAMAVSLYRVRMLEKTEVKGCIHTWYDTRIKEARKAGRFKARAKRQWRKR